MWCKIPFVGSLQLITSITMDLGIINKFLVLEASHLRTVLMNNQSHNRSNNLKNQVVLLFTKYVIRLITLLWIIGTKFDYSYQ